ncbi:MAG: hypothetical protein LW698_15580 [Planctomycetaceae bacterium]|nr:hypothetical protein [Planctomycetaceae bacterium]
MAACTACLPMARGQTAATADAAKVSAWSTGGGSATAKPTDPDGKPAAAAAPSAVAYWQAPPLPAAVIQGGTIPPGWQPQAIPYQGIGPDGRVITQYFAPTYTFTYQVGPPVLAVPQAPAVNRRQAPVYRSPQLYGAAPTPYAPGWNYQAPAVPPVTAQAPPATVARYAPATPPASAPPPPPPAAPPTGWMPSTAPPPTITAPTPVAGWAAAAVPAAGIAAAAATPPPVAAIAPADAAPAMQPVAAPPPTVAVPRSRLWRVVGVQDGDTVTCLDDLNQQRKIGLADIDAPEISQDYGKTAREALAGMVFGRTVEVADGGPAVAGTPTARLSVEGIARADAAVAVSEPGPALKTPAVGRDSGQRRKAGEGTRTLGIQLGKQ